MKILNTATILIWLIYLGQKVKNIATIVPGYNDFRYEWGTSPTRVNRLGSSGPLLFALVSMLIRLILV